MKLLENWELLLAFVVVLLVILLGSLAFYPLDYKDETVNEDGNFFDFSDLTETETSQGIKSPEELESELLLKRAKENMIPMAVCCAIVLSGYGIL